MISARDSTFREVKVHKSDKSNVTRHNKAPSESFKPEIMPIKKSIGYMTLFWKKIYLVIE